MANQLQGLDNVDKKVVLQIFSAYGFGLIKGSITVHATLMDKELLTPTFSIKNNELKVSSELIWYMDNAVLKKLKMSNTSIRVECFHIPANKLISTKRLGYILLKLKGAQTINSTSNDRVVNRSYKLIGSKNCNYNLTMSLSIENYNVITTKTSLKKSNKLRLINNKNININDGHFQTVEENDNYVESIEMDLLKPDINMLEILEQTNIPPEKYEPQNVLNFDVQQKSIVELEDWKNQQMILFNENTKNKEEQLLKEFNNKWIESRKRIEEKLTHEMIKCKALAENMDRMADMLKIREGKITAKELELTSQKDSISNVQTINELSNHIFKLESKLHSSEKTNTILRKENEQLKDDINSICDLHMQQSKNKILNLERKCKDANKTSMFYKEKWIASVKKINQMYKLRGSKSNEYLFNNKKNIQYMLTNQFDEQQHDEEKLRELLDELGKLRQDMNNTN